MKNLKKLSLTALGSSLIATSAFAGALDVSGSAGITFAGADKGTSANGFSMTDEVTFSGGGEMDNGMNVTVSMQLDNNASGGTGQFMDNRSVVIDTNGMGTITFAGHGGDSVVSGKDDVMPTAYGESWDIMSESIDNGGVTKAASTVFNSIASAGSNNILRYDNSDLMDGLTLMASYVPSGAGEANSSTDFALEYTGFDGLTVGYAIGEIDKTTNGVGQDSDTMWANYASGPVTVGFQVGNVEETGQTEHNNRILGISFAVNDSLALSYQILEDEYEKIGANNVTSTFTGISASYTMGSLAIKGTMNDVDDMGGTIGGADQNTELSISVAF